MFAVRLADIHAKQHSFDRAAALLQRVGEALGSCSAPAQLCIAAHAAAVRALASQLGGDLARAGEHCQAGIQLASQALQQAGAGADSAAEPQRHCGLWGEGAEQTSANAALHCEASASSARCTSGARCADDVPAALAAREAAAQLAQLHIRRVECLQQAVDAAGARQSLQDARDVCCQCSCTGGVEAFPLHTAAVLYHEAILELEDDNKVECRSLSCTHTSDHHAWPWDIIHDIIEDMALSSRLWCPPHQVPAGLKYVFIPAGDGCHTHCVPSRVFMSQSLSTPEQTYAQKHEASSWKEQQEEQADSGAGTGSCGVRRGC